MATEQRLEAQWQDWTMAQVWSAQMVRDIHQDLFARLPEGDRVLPKGELLVPGVLRDCEVSVGVHAAPSHKAIGNMLERWGGFYGAVRRGEMQIAAAAASHHRLAWIHPFRDGNGRVARLYTDACFRRLPLHGYGLWNVSRGLARKKADYMAALSWADAPRRNDYDGRGNLSNETLVAFCRFFLTACLDQIAFMHGLLKLDGLLERINGYVSMRGAKLIPGPKPEYQSLKPEAVFMLQEALLRGEVGRGDMQRVSGMAERTGRVLLGQLLEEGLLVSDTPKGVVKLSFPTHIASHLFPDLYPAAIA